MIKRTEQMSLKLRNLPTDPGIYMFKGSQEKIIYIGKAKNLRNRVRTYFQSTSRHDPKTARMLERSVDFELIVTETEVEALILEANLIRQYRPRYNVALKDDKHFPYIKITNEPFPRVIVVRRISKDGATYFGPYTSSKPMRKTLAFLCQIFMIRSCKLEIPHPRGKEHKVCLDYSIKRCAGPCVGLQSREEYAELVESVRMALSGKTKALSQKLNEKMGKASADQEYEAAAQYRDQVEALKSMVFKQHVDVGEPVERDIISIAREQTVAAGVVMQIREGVLIGRQDFQLGAEKDESDAAILETFVTQYYNHQPNLPAEIYLPAELPGLPLFKKWLKQLRGKAVSVVTPQKGKKVRLVDLAAANARLLLDEILIQKQKQSERTSKMVTFLKDDLKLSRAPRTIVCFDISNTGDTDAVGSCVYFTNAKPLKKEYRHFKIKGVKGQDDYKMMREVIGRYFFRIREEKKTPPDLMVVDGGKGQLSSAVAELKHLGFDDQQIIGLAKRLEEVYLPNMRDAVVISKSSPGLILLKQVRDEAHRYAIEYNRKVRSKRTIKSTLDDISGIGPARRDLLLKEFGSVERIKALSATELSQAKGISKSLAEMILKQLQHQGL